MTQLSDLDGETYLEKLAIVAQLSPLFSDSPTPYIQSRFAERIFCLESGAEDLARKDVSFDAKTSTSQGIGIKTYVASSRNTAKVEKIAEFTSYATQGRFGDLGGEALAREVSALRNLRVRSDCSEIGIELGSSFYHCVVRTPGEIFFIEQEYGRISIEDIRPTDRFGKPDANFSKSGHVYFEDGCHGYMFNVAKNVLYRRFDPNSGFVSHSIKLEQAFDLATLLQEIQKLNPEKEIDSALQLDPEFVILPLYSPATKSVAEASGINQWNAGGRARKFSEAYIPVPSQVHKIKPGFFPARDVSFTLRLPNGGVVQASICQDGDKALMSNPNTELCKWLFATIDGSFSEAERRMATTNRPYTYSDLFTIGKDSVRVMKVSGLAWDYEMEFALIGSYENFIEEFSQDNSESL
jgi:hypothetical protein